jgi:hypothetical protein
MSDKKLEELLSKSTSPNIENLTDELKKNVVIDSAKTDNANGKDTTKDNDEEEQGKQLK